MRFLLLLPLLVSFFSFFLPASLDAASTSCVQVIQYAEDRTKTQCQAFPTPCDVPAGWTPVKSCTLTPVVTSVTPVFKAEKFASCEALETKLTTILERYQSRYWYPYEYLYMGSDVRATPLPPMAVEKSVSSPGTVSPATPVSTTNTQVLGIDEADTVKTDGNNIYTYSEDTREIRIVRASDLVLQNTIHLPDTYSSVQLYLASGKLVLVGQKYTTSPASSTSRWYAPETKTVLAVYRITDVKKPVLERYAQIDGSYRDSRVSDGVLYLVSGNDMRLPPIYMTTYSKNANGFPEAISAMKKNFTLKNFAPEIRESIQNSRGKYIQSIRSSVANCSDVTFVLPDAATLKNVDFSPTLVSLSTVSITDPTAKMKSELIFGDVSQIHLSKSGLALTSSVSQSETACPPGAKCIAPTESLTSSTLVHRYALAKTGLRYVSTTIVPGNPMNQYSLDEDTDGNLRVVTQTYAWSNGGNKNTTVLSVISPTGKVIGSLQNIAPGENFQSSRFIGDRLYLVTFEQIDPLFVIDLSNKTAPKILGELKIPGYSTYLHPYDADRLIGIGYDTKTSRWGGVQNAGIKVDLYNVRDVRNPIQEASLVLGDAGSSSDVLSNPRAFVWYKEKKLLLLPATLMKRANDPSDSYRSQSAFQGIVGISILPSSITEKFRITHISLSAELEKAWKADCAQYTGKLPTCKKLLDGSDYCGGSTTYVPPYCYAGSTVETYFASNMWSYSRDFITRALYIGDTFYSVAEGGIKSWSFSDTSLPKASISFTGESVLGSISPIPMMMR